MDNPNNPVQYANVKLINFQNQLEKIKGKLICKEKCCNSIYIIDDRIKEDYKLMCKASFPKSIINNLIKWLDKFIKYNIATSIYTNSGNPDILTFMTNGSRY